MPPPHYDNTDDHYPAIVERERARPNSHINLAEPTLPPSGYETLEEQWLSRIPRLVVVDAAALF